MKKFFLILSISFLFFPLITSADGRYQVQDSRTCGSPYTVEYEGLVPCGRCLEVVAGNARATYGPTECGINTGVIPAAPNNCGASISPKYIPCTICHIFIILNGLINFVMLTIAPPIMILIFSIAGISYYMAGQNPERNRFAKKILTSAIIGFVLIYGSWFIINLILSWVGLTQWTGLEEDWFKVTCKVILP